MTKLSLYVLAATILCCSCSNSTSDKMVSVESTAENDSIECSDEYLGMSHFADTLTVGQYHQMILDAIANGDKSGKWKLSMLMLAWPVD